MANNRLFIYDAENNTACFIAKAFGDGWYVPEDLDVAGALDAFFLGMNGLRCDCDHTASIGGSPTTLRIVTEDDLVGIDVQYINAPAVIASS